jgi:hypothetical protein
MASHIFQGNRKQKTNISYKMIGLIILGFLNAMSDLMISNRLAHWGFWFSSDAWHNKYNWGKYWRHYPLITFTDCFHFFKACWVITMCILIQYTDVHWFISYCIFSTSFSLFHTYLPYLKNPFK